MFLALGTVFCFIDGCVCSYIWTTIALEYVSKLDNVKYQINYFGFVVHGNEF